MYIRDVHSRSTEPKTGGLILYLTMLIFLK